MNFKTEIVDVATRFRLDPLLVMGLATVESSGNAYAWKPEPRFKYFWNVKTGKPFRTVTDAEIASEVAPADFPTLAGEPEQEWWAQQASWGLMQVMGSLARENGFKGLYLTQLVDPLVNLGVGCGVLSDLLTWAKGNLDQAVAAYNGGKRGNNAPPFRNQSYVTKVYAARSLCKLTA